MKAYKGFTKEMKCRDFQYEEGGVPEYVEYDEAAFAEPAQAAETGAPAAEQPTPEEQGEFDFFGDTDGAEG